MFSQTPNGAKRLFFSDRWMHAGPPVQNCSPYRFSEKTCYVYAVIPLVESKAFRSQSQPRKWI